MKHSIYQYFTNRSFPVLENCDLQSSEKQIVSSNTGNVTKVPHVFN